MKEKGKDRDKIRITMGFLVSALVILSISVYIMSAGSLELSEILIFPIVIVLVLFATFFVTKRAKAYKAGLPFDDELEKKVKWKAGYYTFLVTIYVALGTAWYSDFLEEAGTPILGRYVAYIVILSSALLYFIFYLYLSRRGDV